jgi:hypothetical protein
MFDLELTMQRIESLRREVERIEFSQCLPETTQAATNCRKAIEALLEELQLEHECED